MIEYKQLTYKQARTGPEHFLLWLNRQGKEGWELCFTQDVNRWGNKERICFFKRKKTFDYGAIEEKVMAHKLFKEPEPTWVEAPTMPPQDDVQEEIVKAMADDLRVLVALKRVRDFHKSFAFLENRLLGLGLIECLGADAYGQKSWILTATGKEKLDARNLNYF